MAARQAQVPHSAAGRTLDPEDSGSSEATAVACPGVEHESNFADLAELPRDAGAQFEQLVMAEYSDLVESVRSNEELGERRLSAYLTVIAAVTAAVGLASGRYEQDAEPLIAVGVVAAVLMLAFGLMTLRRVMERNITTSTYLNGLRRIRAYFAQSDPHLAHLFVFPPERSSVERTRTSTYGIGKGGLLETVAALNCVIAGVAAGGTTALLSGSRALSIVVGTAGAIGSWFAQLAWAGSVYRTVTIQRSKRRDEDLAAWMEWSESRA